MGQFTNISPKKTNKTHQNTAFFVVAGGVNLNRWTNGNQRCWMKGPPLFKGTRLQKKRIGNHPTIHFFHGKLLVLVGECMFTPKNVPPPTKMVFKVEIQQKESRTSNTFFVTVSKKKCFRFCILELVVQFQEMYTVDLRHEKFDSLFTTIQGFLK